ncbi:MAG: hypothetical protein J6K43_05635 [Lachnospiraceae bacterium]|nr:hypothetical protein [Lachnospiraceae bacterium]
MKKPIYVKTQYKDTLFRMLFREKQKLLELYNAINGTDYKNPNELEVVTLENAVYMSIKNDVSRRLIKLPTPKFVVFYNGAEKQPERKELHLSDAFEVQEDYPALDLHVTQLNINQGYNVALLEKCPTLFQYMQYVEQVRKYRQQFSLEKAVQFAVDYCIKNGILKDFLLENKAEVIKMSIYEYDEELHKKTLHDEGYEDGFNDGFNDGESANLIKLICRKLQKNKTPDTIAEELEEDLDTIRHICDVAKSFAPEYDVNEIMKELNSSSHALT